MDQCKTQKYVMWQYTDQPDADIYFAYNKKMVQEINQFSALQGRSGCAVAVGSARIEEIKNSTNATFFNKGNKVITYALGLMYGEVNRSNWTDIQTFKTQSQIVESFAEFPEKQFVIKGLPASDGSYNPLPDYLTDLNLTNCEYKTDRFPNYLEESNLFIFEMTSTAMFEAMVTEIPIIYYHSNGRPLPPHFELLKQRITIVENPIELKEAIINSPVKRAISNEFLNKYMLAEKSNCTLNAVNLIKSKINAR
ncbi:hypothetical protein HQ571_04775 [Candidatus Kuenenbacteria bacterium]|nr:hypothetical protein [Candidatus Kuenenbacteria bacterium]